MKKISVFLLLPFLAMIGGCSQENIPSLSVLIKSVELDRAPHSMIQTPDSRQMLVSCFGGESVVSVSLANQALERKYTVRKGPSTMIRDLEHGVVYCLHNQENAIAVFGGDPIDVRQQLGTGSMSLADGAVRPGYNEVWICDGISAVSILQTPSLNLKKKIQLGRYPQSIAFSRDGQKAYVTLKGENAVAVIDAVNQEKIETIQVGIYPKDILIAGQTACVSNFGSHDVSLIDISKNKETTRIKVRKKPNALAVHENTLWVSCERSYRVVAIDIAQAKMIGTVKVGFYPGDVEALKDGSLVVAASKKNRITFVTLKDSLPDIN